MNEEEKSKKFTRRQVLKIAGATAAGVAASSMVRRFIKPVNIIAGEKEKPSEVAPMATTEAERKELAQKLKCAKPGEKFGFGHITWHLAQEYAIMNQMGHKRFDTLTF